MSAGIIVMNRNAIAMAADSAVTIGDHVAIHNSANKLFALSMYEPVGAIIYANSQLMQIPMEIIIKQYKTELGTKSFLTLQEYVDDFINFMESHIDLFHFSANEESYVKKVCDDILQGLANGYGQRAKRLIEKEHRILSEDENKRFQNEAIQEFLAFVDAQNIAFSDFAEYVKDKYKNVIIAEIKAKISWAGNLEELSEKIIKLFDTDFMRHEYMGVAIAGYGRSEIFPHMVHLKLSGILNGKLRFVKIEEYAISELNPAAITPLAQIDVMDTFIRGVNGIILQELKTKIPGIINAKLATIDENSCGEGGKEHIANVFKNVKDEIIQSVLDISNHIYVAPIIMSVGTLPIEELAMFAESMINITSVRRRVAIDGNIGTVGGPIDVSIVTRGDGFIWLKRKHYFEAKMNPQFMYSKYGQLKLGE